MSDETDAAIGFRVGAVEGRVTAINERLRAVDRIEERLLGVVEDVTDIKNTLKERGEADAESRAAGRRDLKILGGTIVAAIIGAAGLILSSGPSP